MASKSLLDTLELPLAQCIDVEDRRALVRHAVHGLDGDLLQQLGRRAARVAITGVVAGPDARQGLEELREKSRSAQPVDFVADVATATAIQRVIVERWDVRELSGRPERWQYALLLREHLDPPPSAATDAPTTTAVPAPSTDTGTLVVEVVVEGEPDFDPSRVTVTAERAGPGGAASRTLTQRTGNRWTDAATPPADYTVHAAVADPALSGSATATVRAGQTAQVRITLVRSTAVARAFMVSFRFDSAFVEPCMRATLRRAAAYLNARPSERLVVAGHTDKAGPGAYNQSLSERRARAVFAALSFGNGTAAADAAVAEWTAIRQPRTGHPLPTERDAWGVREYQQMLQQLGDYPGEIDGRHRDLTDAAVRAFRCRKGLPPGTTVDDAVWAALIRDYLADEPPTVAASRYLPNCAGTALEWLGAGEEDPVPGGNVPVPHRPDRRVELLMTTAAALPCGVPVPDTWGLPAPGRPASAWCLGPGAANAHACFATRNPPVTPPRWEVRDADAGPVDVRGTIEREVEDPATGAVTRRPAAGVSIVLVTPRGEFLRGETPSGNGRAATTDAAGAFSFPGKPAGVYALELQDEVVARLADAPDAPALGPTVCKAILSSADRLDVLILRDPVLREIRLPVIVHRMTALHPATREVRTCPDPLAPGTPREQRTARDAAGARALVRETNGIWGRARIRLEVRSVIDEAFATPGRNECAVDADELGDLLVESATSNVVNLYLFGTLASSGTAGMHATAIVHDAAGLQVRRAEGVALADRVLLSLFAGVDPVPVEPGPAELPVILGHLLGLQLGLPPVTGTGPQAQNRLMLPQHAPTHRRLVQVEVVAARAAPGARDCIPLRLEVTGAVRFGGGLGHRYAAIRDAAAPPVEVRDVFPPHLTRPPGSTVRIQGGTIDPATGDVTVSRAAVVRQEVVARFEPGSAGGPGLETHVVVYVLDFDVDVAGARRLAPAPATRFYAIRGATPLTARAILFPEPPVVPGDLATWGPAGQAHPDPLRRRVPRAAAGAVSLPVTVADVTRTIELTVAEDFRLEVPGAVRLGPDRFLAAVDPARAVTIRAVLSPAPDPLPADLVTWGGNRATIAVSPVERTMARVAPAGVFTVTATIGDVTHGVTIELVTMSIQVDGAVQAGGPAGTEFFAEIHPTAVVTARLVLSPPASAPLPPGSVTWSPPVVPGPDQLRGTLRRNAVARTPVRATLTGTTATAHFTVVQIEVSRAAGAAAPAATSVQVGLWDNAFDPATGQVLRGPTEAGHFVGADSRHFFFRVRDPSAAGPVSIDWRTRTRAGVDVDAPASQALTLAQTGAGSGVFSSPAVMLVTDADDKAQPTNSGGTPAAAGADGGPGGPNHRLRLISVDDAHPLDSEVFAEYTPAGAPVPVARVRVPVFERTPEERLRLRVHLVDVRATAGGAGTLGAVRHAALIARFRAIYARCGIFVEFDDIALDPPASCIGWATRYPTDLLAQDPAVEDSHTSLFGNLEPSPSMRDAVNAVRARPGFNENDIYLMYVNRIYRQPLPPPGPGALLRVGPGGISYPDSFVSGSSILRGFAFVGVLTTNDLADAHESTHITTNAGHFDLEAASAGAPGNIDERNLMQRHVLLVGLGVRDSKRLWNRSFANPHQGTTNAAQVDAIRDCRFKRPY